MSSDIDILISEVGPRDGLQNTKVFMTTEYKRKWISAAAAAGDCHGDRPRPLRGR